MKKNFKTLLILITIILMTGCGSEKKEKLDKNISKTINIDEEDAKLVCTTDYDYTELNYTIGSKYVVFADDNNKVTKVVSEEIISSTDKDKLDEFESYLTENHNAAVQYSGYDYNVKREKNKVISDVTIDYSEFNMKQFTEDNKDAIDEELTLDEIEEKYVSLGASCSKK